MNEQAKLSPFQLTAMLICGRLFTIITWSQKGTVEAGSQFAGLALGAVVQFLLALLLVRLLNFPGNEAKPRWYFRPLLVVCWVVCLAAAAATAASSADFLSTCYYAGGRRVLMLVMLTASGVFTAWLGLHAFMRASPWVALLALAGLGALAAGALGSMHAAYLPPLELSLQGVGRTALYSTVTNTELLLLPLLTAHATKRVKKRALTVWLGGTAAVSAGLSLAVMLALGYYAQGRRFPVFELARASRLMTERLDTVLMGIWVLLAFLRLSVLLWLCCDLWHRLVCPVRRTRQPVLHGAAAVLAALLLLSGCAHKGAASETGSIANKTLVTMLELSSAPDGVTLRVEYMDMSQGKDKKRYLVCGETAKTLEKALERLEQDFSRTFYLKDCGLAVFSGEWEAEALEQALEQLDGLGQLRPLAKLLLSPEPVLEPGSEEEGSAADGLRRLFQAKGGRLDDSFTLKDGVARLRDPRMPVILPKISKKDGQPVADGFTEFG